MACKNFFSKRLIDREMNSPENLCFDDIPLKLRKQIVMILSEDLSKFARFRSSGYFEDIVRTIRRHIGEECLVDIPYDPAGYNPVTYITCQDELRRYFYANIGIEKLLDVIEAAFDPYYFRYGEPRKRYEEAVEELNQRFLDHGIGYHLNAGQIIRVDSEYAHTEIIRPALRLLSQEHLEGAQQEFLLAHGHFRKGRFKEAITECNKALESTMTSISKRRQWINDTNRHNSSELIDICFENGLIPKLWSNHFNCLKSLLGGIGTGRNNLSAHGQGESIKKVARPTVNFILNMTASAIAYLAESEKALN